MEQTQRLTEVRGADEVGLYLFICFLIVHVPFSFHLSAEMNGSGEGAPPSRQLNRRRRKY